MLCWSKSPLTGTWLWPPQGGAGSNSQSPSDNLVDEMRIPRRAFVSQKAPLPEGNARLPPAALILTRLGNGSLSPCLVRIALGVIEAEATLKMRIFPHEMGEISVRKQLVRCRRSRSPQDSKSTRAASPSGQLSISWAFTRWASSLASERGQRRAGD
jgi:hypothetical protein